MSIGHFIRRLAVQRLSDSFVNLKFFFLGHRFLTARHYYWYRLARHGGRDDIAARLIVVESGESDDEANVAAAAERLIAENVKLTSAEAERWLQNETSVSFRSQKSRL